MQCYTNLRFRYLIWIQPWKAPLACNVMTTPISVARTTSMFRLNVYCDVTNFAPFLLLRHVGAYRHHLLWRILTKVVPGLIWMRADMTVYQPEDSLYNGQRIVTHVPVGFCTKFSYFNPELRIFMNFSWVIVMHHFVSCSNVYLKIIVKYEDDHHIRDPLTRDLDFPIFFLIDFKFWHVHFRLCHSVSV